MSEPTVIGFCSGMTVRVDLPSMVDRHDMAGAVAALVAVGALPDEKGMYR